MYILKVQETEAIISFNLETGRKRDFAIGNTIVDR